MWTSERFCEKKKNLYIYIYLRGRPPTWRCKLSLWYIRSVTYASLDFLTRYVCYTFWSLCHTWAKICTNVDILVPVWDEFGWLLGPLWRLEGPLGPHYAKVGTMGWIPEAVAGQMGPTLGSKWSNILIFFRRFCLLLTAQLLNGSESGFSSFFGVKI